MTFQPNKYGYTVIGIILILLILMMTNATIQSKVLSTINYLKEKTWDFHSDRRIAKLHPNIRAKAKEFIIRAKKELGIKLRVTSSLRTFDEQEKLYNKGRTEKGKIVTNAKAGESYHNYGLAIDVVEIKDGKALWDNPNWDKIAELGKSIGFEWGGDWRGFTDKPHFQYSFGYSTAQLKLKKQSGEISNNYVNLV